MSTAPKSNRTTPEGLCTKCSTEPCAEHAVASISRRRKYRVYQSKSRPPLRSWATLYENAAIIAAWMGDEISEGQAAKALGMDRLDAREFRDNTLMLGLSLASIAKAEGKS